MNISDIHKAITDLEAAMDAKGFTAARVDIRFDSARNTLIGSPDGSSVNLWHSGGKVIGFSRGADIAENISNAFAWIGAQDETRKAKAEFAEALRAARKAGVDVKEMV